MEVEPLAAGDPAQPDIRGASGPLSLWFGAEAVAGEARVVSYRSLWSFRRRAQIF
jgi:hypothetical protein